MANDCNYKTVFQVRIDAETKEKALAIAKAENVSLSKIVNMAIRQIAEKGTTKLNK